MTRQGPCLLTAVLALGLALVPGAALAQSGLRCTGGLVSLGDSKLDLLAKCGGPALAEHHTEERSLVDVGRGLGYRVLAPVERWTYDHGRNRFIDVVTLVRGKVAAVERGSYGFSDGPTPSERPRKATCDPAQLAAGKLALEVLARCGEPALVDAWREELRDVVAVDGTAVYAGPVSRAAELWTYDFGPNRFLRFVQLEGGKVTRVETGGYGYGE